MYLRQRIWELELYLRQIDLLQARAALEELRSGKLELELIYKVQTQCYEDAKFKPKGQVVSRGAW